MAHSQMEEISKKVGIVQELFHSVHYEINANIRLEEANVIRVDGISNSIACTTSAPKDKGILKCSYQLFELSYYLR